VNDALPLEHAVATLRAFHQADPAVVSGRGLEAIVAGATFAVSRKVWLLPGRRERGCALLRGCPADQLDAARPYRVVPPGPSPVARALYAVGLAEGDGALVFLGSGSVSYGGFAEALSATRSAGVAVRFVVSWYTQPGPFATQLAVSPAELAGGFGLPSAVVDGRDAEAVRAAVASMGGGGLVQAQL